MAVMDYMAARILISCGLGFRVWGAKDVGMRALRQRLDVVGSWVRLVIAVCCFQGFGFTLNEEFPSSLIAELLSFRTLENTQLQGSGVWSTAERNNKGDNRGSRGFWSVGLECSNAMNCEV